MRQQVAAVKRDHPTYQQIADDNTVGKRDSHIRLIAFVKKYKAEGMGKVYKKTVLTSLCKAYGIITKSKDNKKKLSNALVTKLLSSTDAVIPQPWHLRLAVSSHTTFTGEREEHIVLRISMSRLE